MRWFLFLLTVASLPVSVACGDDIGLKAPPGFEVTLFADDDLAHDIYAMTIDSHGRVVVSGAGYIKTLHDDDNDGKADRSTWFSNLPKSGAHGMVFLGERLLFTGDNSLSELVDADGDGKAEGEPKQWAAVRNPEHGANGLTVGPDGWIYLICGNDAGLKNLDPTARSPVKKAQCGGVARLSPDGKQIEVYADGMRNPYDLAFDQNGFLFTVDADGERDQHLPWYTPNRLFDISQGSHHGWIQEGWQKSWNRPEYFFDSVERMVEVGRGSPTGVAVNRHYAFPPKYFNQVFSVCWTLGKVYCFPRQLAGASATAETEIFLQTTGEVGFAPVDLAFGPQGDLFVAIGGRRTRGGVFRVRYIGDDSAEKPIATTPLEKLLTAPQPLSAWSRANWQPLARTVGKIAISNAAVDEKISESMRLRAIDVLVSEFGGLDDATADALMSDKATAVRAKAVWAVGRGGDDSRLAKATFDKHPLVRRYAWEGLQTCSTKTDAKADWSAINTEPDRRVRRAAILAQAACSSSANSLRIKAARGELTTKELAAAMTQFHEAQSISGQLESLRLTQIALGDVNVTTPKPEVYAGYSFNAPDSIQAEAKAAWEKNPPRSTDDTVQREIARTAAGIGASIDAFEFPRWLGDSDSAAPADIHYLISISRMPGPRSPSQTDLIAHLLVMLPIKMREQERFASRNWPTRVSETYRELVARDARLVDVVMNHPRFETADHAMYVLSAPKSKQADTARRLLKKAKANRDLVWSESLIEVVKVLPFDEAATIMREQFGDARLQDDIVAFLAAKPTAVDRPKFVIGLASVQPQVVERSANALRALGGKATEVELLAAMRSLQRHLADIRLINARRALTAFLNRASGQSIVVKETTREPLAKTYSPWFQWFARKHGKLASQLTGFSPDGESWRKRLTKVDWQNASAAAGKIVFEKKLCHRCHGASDRLGPDLKGAAARFSRDDLFAAIIDPNLNVSPLYQSTRVMVDNGKVYFGIPVYASPDGTLLQTGPGATVRIAGDEILDMRKTATSLMPSGLLNDASDAELADLYAYLRTLK